MFETKKEKNEETPTEMAVSQLAIDASCRDWTVGSGRARPLLTILEWLTTEAKITPRGELHAGGLPAKSHAAGPPRDVGCSVGARRLQPRHKMQLGSGEAAAQGQGEKTRSALGPRSARERWGPQAQLRGPISRRRTIP